MLNPIYPIEKFQDKFSKVQTIKDIKKLCKESRINVVVHFGVSCSGVWKGKYDRFKNKHPMDLVLILEFHLNKDRYEAPFNVLRVKSLQTFERDFVEALKEGTRVIPYR